MHFTKRLTACVAAAITVVAPVTLGGTAQAADLSAERAKATGSVALAAADGNATLEIYDFNDGGYWITVSGRANLASVNPGNMYITLYADDTWFDDNIYSTGWVSTNADGSFSIEFYLCCSVLDEDWGQDEVYAKARAWHKPGGGNVTLTTNTVRGDF